MAGPARPSQKQSAASRLSNPAARANEGSRTMNDEVTTQQHFIVHRSHFIVLSYAAIPVTPPPIIRGTGVHAGPVWKRGFFQQAVIHTLVPASSVGLKLTMKSAFDVSPSKSHSSTSVGGVSPANV